VRGELVWGDGRFWVKEGSAAARKKGGGEKDEPRRFQVNVSRSLYTSCSRSIRIGMRCSSVAAAARSCAFELFEEEKSVTNGKKRAEEGNVQQYRCPQLPSNPLQLLLNLLLRPPQFEPLRPNQSCSSTIAATIPCAPLALSTLAAAVSSSNRKSRSIQAWTRGCSEGGMEGKGSPGSVSRTREKERWTGYLWEGPSSTGTREKEGL
jgi:hypothetical protein